MKTSIRVAVVSGCVALVGVIVAGSSHTSKADTIQCVFNSECSGNLVCAGHMCRAACGSDKDCPVNNTCVKNATEMLTRCVPNVQPGGIFGYAQDDNGGPVACRVHVVDVPTLTAYCDATGMFQIANVPAGSHRIDINAPGVFVRQLSVPVMEHSESGVGTVVLHSTPANMPQVHK
jgi:hypothetical protein